MPATARNPREWSRRGTLIALKAVFILSQAIMSKSRRRQRRADLEESPGVELRDMSPSSEMNLESFGIEGQTRAGFSASIVASSHARTEIIIDDV
jgi:hypothetical protein